MKNSQDFKKILAVLSISALAIFALHYFTYVDIKTKNESISGLQYDLSTKASKQDYLISTERSLDKFAVELGLAQSSVVSKEEEIKFIEKIESIARNNGLTIDISSLALTSEELPSPDLIVLKIQVTTNGSWRGHYMFLAEVESLPLKLKVSRSSLVRTGVGINLTDGGWSNNIDISVLKYK